MKFIKNFVRALEKQTQISPQDIDGKVPKVFYCHIPKCAGSAISAQIRQRLFDNYRVGTFNVNLKASQKSSQAFLLDMMKVREIILAYNLSIPNNYFGFGHVYCRPKLIEFFKNEWNFVTILRNPIERWISEYTYNTYKKEDWAKNSLSIEDYIESERGRLTGISFIKYFSGIPDDYVGDYEEFVNEAIENLGRFSVIGTVENLEKWCESFKVHFGKSITIPRKNTSPKPGKADKIRSDDVLMKKIAELCEPDLRVYRRIVEQINKFDVTAARR